MPRFGVRAGRLARCGLRRRRPLAPPGFSWADYRFPSNNWKRPACRPQRFSAPAKRRGDNFLESRLTTVHKLFPVLDLFLTPSIVSFPHRAFSARRSHRSKTLPPQLRFDNRFYFAVVVADRRADFDDIAKPAAIFDHRSRILNLPDDADEFELTQLQSFQRREIFSLVGFITFVRSVIGRNGSRFDSWVIRRRGGRLGTLLWQIQIHRVWLSCPSLPCRQRFAGAVLLPRPLSPCSDFPIVAGALLTLLTASFIFSDGVRMVSSAATAPRANCPK